MNPRVLLYGFLIFFICLFIHILIWRLRHPRHQILLLGIIFIIAPPIIFIFGFPMLSPSLTDWLAILLLHFALSVSYIFSYPAAQAVSPSLKILLLIKASLPNGITYEQLVRGFEEKFIFDKRVQDLINDSLVVKTPDGLELTSAGAMLIRGFVFMRKFLGLPIGEG